MVDIEETNKIITITTILIPNIKIITITIIAT